MASDPTTLVELLGDTRARVVSELKAAPQSVAELAERVGVTQMAIRKHLHALERDGFVSAETVRREGRGRPGSRYRLTAKARRLFPDRSAELANELFDFITDRHGRPELLAFLRWRAERQSAHFAVELADAATLPERAEALAGALTAEGFDSSIQTVTAPDGATVLQLKQGHCAIADVAREHPELCAFEASLFKDLLGARLSRRQTIAGGADACVCTITPSVTESSPRSAAQEK